MTRIRTGLAIAFVALVGGLTARSLIPDQLQPGLHVRIPWDGGAPADSICVELDGLSSPEARALFGLSPDGGAQYARIRMAAVPSDEEKPGLPEGMLALEGSIAVLDGGCEYAFEAWLPGAEGAPFRCACSTGDDCETQMLDGSWATAPLGVTLDTWRGDGCFPKVCVEVLGASSWPAECPTGVP